MESMLGPIAAAGQDRGGLDITVLVKGGGVTGQTDAVKLGMARALVKMNGENGPIMRKNGYLTRDARVKERKKPGLKRARKAPTYTKR
jgi:small subunit ribosomal protein S9